MAAYCTVFIGFCQFADSRKLHTLQYSYVYVSLRILRSCILYSISISLFLSVFQFGESQKLRLVRILRSTVMVRVGGGWMALDEFLVKNDPCRGQLRHQRHLVATRDDMKRSPFASKRNTNIRLVTQTKCVLNQPP